MRGPRRHFTHSKVLAWVAADRMASAVRAHHLYGPADRWEALGDTIHADVLAHGYNPDRNTFTQSYDAPGLDAALLMIPRVGFLPPDDSRVLGTIAAIQNELTEGGFVKRYETSTSDDGLPGGEGLFLACSFWLVDALHLAGQQTEATQLFERLLALRNDVGLLSEEWDPHTGRQLGNTPQAFSHFPLVTSALQLHAGRPHHSNHPSPRLDDLQTSSGMPKLSRYRRDCRSSQTSDAGHFDRPQATNWNVTLPPATTGTGAATPPENTSCPARKPSPSAASWWPATPPTRPGGPSPQLTRAAGDRAQVEPPALALSATTSVRVNLKPS